LDLIPAEAGLYFGAFVDGYAGATQIAAKIGVLCDLHALGLDIANHQPVNDDMLCLYITI
jgi:hypothetical protein